MARHLNMCNSFYKEKMKKWKKVGKTEQNRFEMNYCEANIVNARLKLDKILNARLKLGKILNARPTWTKIAIAGLA